MSTDVKSLDFARGCISIQNQLVTVYASSVIRAPKVKQLAVLECFPQLLQETEHLWRWRKEKVAKIVPYAPPLIQKTLRKLMIASLLLTTRRF